MFWLNRVWLVQEILSHPRYEYGNEHFMRLIKSFPNQSDRHRKEFKSKHEVACKIILRLLWQWDRYSVFSKWNLLIIYQAIQRYPSFKGMLVFLVNCNSNPSAKHLAAESTHRRNKGWDWDGLNNRSRDDGCLSLALKTFPLSYTKITNESRRREILWAGSQL